MKNINTVFGNNRPLSHLEYGNSLTVQGASVNLTDLLKEGTIDEISTKLKKRMIFGERIKIEDLSKLDYFKNKIIQYENLIKTHNTQTAKKINNAVTERDNHQEPTDKIKTEKSTKQTEISVDKH